MLTEARVVVIDGGNGMMAPRFGRLLRAGTQRRRNTRPEPSPLCCRSTASVSSSQVRFHRGIHRVRGPTLSFHGSASRFPVPGINPPPPRAQLREASRTHDVRPDRGYAANDPRRHSYRLEVGVLMSGRVAYPSR